MSTDEPMHQQKEVKLAPPVSESVSSEVRVQPFPLHTQHKEHKGRAMGLQVHRRGPATHHNLHGDGGRRVA